MKYDHEKADTPCTCPSCGWAGRLEQTHDQDVLDRDFATIGMTCVCPRCAAEVAPSLPSDRQAVTPPE